MSTKTKFALTPIALAMAVSLPIATPSFAQDSGAFMLEEIVVTARKVEESLQDVPLSISAFSAADVKRRSIEELEDVALQTPGLTFEDFSNGGFGAPIIRGASQLTITQLEQNVSTFFDGVYIPRQYAIDVGATSLERIEVVKGPQSALYGANAFVGAINYVSVAPDLEEFNADISVTLGDNEREELSGAVSIPVVPGKLAVRLAGGLSEFDGDYVNNHPDANAGVSPGTDGNIGGWDNDSYQIGVAARPIDSVSIDVNYNFFEVDTESRASSRLTRGGGDTNCSEAIVFFTPTNQLFCGELPSAPVAGPSGVEGFVIDPRTFGLVGETEILRAKIGWDITDNVSLSYQYGNVQGEAFSAGNSDRDALEGTQQFVAPFATLNSFTYIPNGNFDYDSHELRIDYTADSGVYVMAGVFYSDGIDNETTSFGSAPFRDLTPLTEIPFSVLTVDTAIETELTSIFGRLSVPLMDDKLIIAVEGRYTEEDKPVTEVGFFTGTRVFEYEDDYFTPRLSVDYKLTEDSLIYASVAKGVKSGGINTSSFADLITEEREYDPDENVTFEIGSKNTFLDGRMQFNASAFLIDWEDLQVGTTPTNAPLNTATIITNLGGAESKGIEMDLSFLVTENVSLNAGLAVIDATYDEGTVSGRIARVGLCDDIICRADGSIGGNDLPRSSDLQWNIGVMYEGDISNNMTFFVRGDVAGQSDQAVSEINVATIPSRQLVNLRAGIEQGDWSAAFYVKNATDRQYVSNAFFIANPFQVDYVPSYGNLRRIGLTVDYSF